MRTTRVLPSNTVVNCLLVSGSRSYLALILLLVWLPGCGADYTRVQPRREDLTGTWLPTPDTISDMRRRGRYEISNHELRLQSDGAFSIKNVPDWVHDVEGRSHQKLESGSGKWTLSWEDYGSMKYVVYLAFSDGGHLTFHLCHQARPYLLRYGIGDPDSGNSLAFERLSDLK